MRGSILQAGMNKRDVRWMEMRDCAWRRGHVNEFQKGGWREGGKELTIFVFRGKTNEGAMTELEIPTQAIEITGSGYQGDER